MESPPPPEPPASAEREAEPEGGLLGDLHQFGLALVGVARGGGVPALVSFVPFALFGTFLVAVALAVALMCCLAIPVAMVVGSFALAAFTAGPFAAFTLAAEGRDPTVWDALIRASERLVHLTLVYLLVALLAAGVEVLTLGAMIGLGRPNAALGLQVLGGIAALVLHAKFLTLAPPIACAGQRTPPIWPDFARVGALARGHMGILIPSAAAPYLVPLVAKPSAIGVELGRDLFGQGNVHAAQAVMVVVAVVLAFFVGPLCAVAAWAVATRAPVTTGAQG